MAPARLARAVAPALALLASGACGVGQLSMDGGHDDTAPGDGGLREAGADALRDSVARQCLGYTRLPTGVLNRTVAVNGRTRSYVWSVPATYDGTFPVPLVFAWHDVATSAGNNGAQARTTFDLEAQAPGTAMFVYPEALPLASLQNQVAWDLSATGDDVRLFDALFTTLTGAACIDHLQVFSVGHGRGGTFSSQLACLRGGTIRSSVSVAGAAPTASCGGGKGVWLAAGQNDTITSYATATAARDAWLSINGCGSRYINVSPWPCVLYVECRVDQPVTWCAHDGKHEWPAFAPSGAWGFLTDFHVPAVSP